MEIAIKIATKAEVTELLLKVLADEFSLEENYARHIINEPINGLIRHFDQLADDCYFLAETNYIDKVYRDTFYNYYSTKLNEYNRFCVRISIFRGQITIDDFRSKVGLDILKKKYYGFIILRPLDPSFLGRSIISVKAIRNNDFLCCAATFQTSVNSIKQEVTGFPHSSQDAETLSCAETTIWSIMEYFSCRYPDYKPVLPSHIIKMLNQVSAERQIPSRGLNIQQISFALREFGFGTRIYSRKEYNNDFERLISCYIESEIPLLVAIENRHVNGNIGHALVCIGHVKVNDSQIENAVPSINSNQDINDKCRVKGITFHDYDDLKKEFVFIDDNQPVYKAASLEKPAQHYIGNDWHSCIITYFIAPLYPKIYLEAFEAKNFIFSFLLSKDASLEIGSKVLLRVFLAFTRTYKEYVALDSEIQQNLKGLILSTVMPKFVWIAELSTKQLFKQNKANGLVILDATEANIFSYKPLVLAFYQNRLIYFDKKDKKLITNYLDIQNFNIFGKNLKASEND